MMFCRLARGPEFGSLTPNFMPSSLSVGRLTFLFARDIRRPVEFLPFLHLFVFLLRGDDAVLTAIDPAAHPHKVDAESQRFLDLLRRGPSPYRLAGVTLAFLSPSGGCLDRDHDPFPIPGGEGVLF